MEVRKANQQIIQTEISQKSEVSKTKNAVQKLISDSFEKENSKSSDSNSSSTASSEPEKKAGQITSGILVKQMTAARIGETNAKQSGEVSGKKDLSPEQQASVSNSDPRKKNLDSSFFLQDARSKDEDRKNSGLQPPFSSNKGPDANAKFSKVDKDQIIASLGQTGSEQTSDAVKDADRFVNGGSLRSQVDAEVAERHQDSNALGGSRTDRLSDLLNPTATGPQQSGQTYGKDQLAFGRGEAIMDYLAKKDGKFDQFSTRQNKDKSTTYIHDEAGELKEGGIYISHTEDTHKEDKTSITDTTKTELRQDDTKVVTHTKSYFDADGKLTKSTTTTTTTPENGSPQVKTETITRNKDGTYTKTTTEPTTAGGKPVSYDQENYTGNIPDAVKKTMDYFRQQAISQKPQSGGETVHTDDSATGGTITGGPVSNLFVQQGSLGLFGNPGSPDLQTGSSSGRGPVGSSQSGGNVDYGPDSDKVGYTGPTHEDDPGDVQFGPQTPVAEGSVESKNTDDDSSDSNDFIDILNRNHKKGAVN
jgi:hypothetical protein